MLLGEEKAKDAKAVEKSLLDALVLVRGCCVGEEREEGGRTVGVEEEGGMATVRKMEDGFVERVRGVLREEVERGFVREEVERAVEGYMEKRGGVAAGKRSEGEGRKGVLGGRRR